MARKKIQSATDQRTFIMVYQDFLESDLLDNYFQKLVFIYLKKFADSKNQCYPSLKTIHKLTGISVNKIKITLGELEEKGVITKKNRTRADGGKTSNLYTLHDFRELWSSGDGEDVRTVIEEYEENRIIEMLESKGYKVTKQKEPVCEPTKAHTQALEINQSDIVNTTIDSLKSQEIERFSIEQIQQFFDYENMVNDNPLKQNDVDSVINILHTYLNTTKKTIRIGGEDKPSMVVQAKLLKLTSMEIMYCIDRYQEQTQRIKNATAYMLTLLYHSKEQLDLDITNQVQHDMHK